ncbi:MAG: Gp49 family protein [Halioglobus sp.]
MNEAQVEQVIQEKGLTAPRLTPELIDDAILTAQYRVFPDTGLTVCYLTLKNGHTVTGESACASPENFNAELGRNIAYDNARDKIWALEGYLLKQKLALGECYV